MRKQGKKSWKAWARLVAVVAVIVLAMVGLPVLVGKIVKYDEVTIEMINGRAGTISLESAEKVFMASQANGWTADHTEGESARTVFAYFRYLDEGTADAVARVEKLLGEGEVKVVWRNLFTEEMAYSLERGGNGVTMALAAEAAGKQGYWKGFMMMALERREEWATAEDVREVAVRYFEEVSAGGDVARFREDMRSGDVVQKLAFDAKCFLGKLWRGEAVFVLDGEEYNIDELEAVIREK